MPVPITLVQLRIFAAVAGHDSFSQAAEDLHVSQPYVSGQILALEGRLGMALFNRVGRRAYLNDAGKLFLKYADRVLDTLKEAERSLDEFRGMVTGSITIAATSTPGAYVLPRILRRFLDDYPAVEITLELKDKIHVEQMIQKHQADVGLVGSQPISRELSIEVLGYDQLLLAVNPNHRWANRSPVALHELSQERLIVRERTSGTRISIEEAFAAAGVHPQSRFELTNTDAIKEAVAAGLGVAFISERAMRQELATKRLVAAPLSGHRLARPFCLLTLPGQRLSLAAAVLSSLIVADFENSRVD